MFHLSAYQAALGVNAANTALTFNAEETFVRSQAGNLIVTEKYKLIAARYLATSATRARFDSSTLAAVGRPQIYPFSRSAVEVDLPPVNDWRDYPLNLPVNEEVAMQGSNNLGVATENSVGFVWIATPDFNRNLPAGIQRQKIHATAAVTTVANTWTLSAAIVLDENLRGGVYSVVGLASFEANNLACRFNFPTAPTVNGRRFKPGALCNNALGDRPFDAFCGGFGEWGRFQTFELPSIEAFSTDAAAKTIDLWIDTVYLGSSISLLYR